VDRLGIRDVGDRGREPGVVTGGLGQPAQGVRVEVDRADGQAVGQQPVDGRPADPAGRATDDGDTRPPSVVKAWGRGPLVDGRPRRWVVGEPGLEPGTSGI
jgi:hypothetical protein